MTWGQYCTCSVAVVPIGQEEVCSASDDAVALSQAARTLFVFVSP